MGFPWQVAFMSAILGAAAGSEFPCVHTEMLLLRVYPMPLQLCFNQKLLHGQGPFSESLWSLLLISEGIAGLGPPNSTAAKPLQ